MTSAESNLAGARTAYQLATDKYLAAMRNGDVGEDDDPSSGRRYRAATPRGGLVMGIWQKCKAELDAASAIHRRECGDAACAICDHTQRRMRSLPTAEQLADLRLPPSDRE